MQPSPIKTAGTSSALTASGSGHDEGARARPALNDYGGAAPEVHPLDYVRTLYKRRWTAVATFVAVVVGAAVYLLTITPVYEARARLLIESDKANVVTFKEVIEEDQATDAYYQTEYKLLEGAALAERTIDVLQLQKHPELIGRGRLQAAIRAVRRVFGQSAPPVDAPQTAESTQRTQAVEAFLNRLVISPIKNTRLVDVRYRSSDAGLAAQVANAHARGYIEQNLEFKILASKEASGWLVEQLAEQRKKVEESEVAVQRYREQNDALSLEERQNIVVQKLTDLNAAVTKAKTERMEKEALYRQFSTIEHDPAALDSFPAVLSNTFIQKLKTQLAELQQQQAQLSERLGQHHPDMIKVTSAIQSAEAKLQAEIAKVVQSVRNDYLAALAQERSLVDSLEAQKGDALALNRKGIAGNVLTREAESNRQLYESLLKRVKETGVSGELKNNNIRLVDVATTPRAPVSPNKQMILMMALVGGTLLAVAMAFLVDFLDDRIKTPDEIRVHLGLPTLGLVPAVAPEIMGGHPLISNGVPLHFAEAFRMVRTSVLFCCAGEARIRSVVVTSTTPGEGKTLTAANLAVGIAQAGERVLLVDTDMRRPQVHQVFDLEQEPGLSDLLSGNTHTKEAMRPSGVSGLWILPAGRIPPNPAELLASQRFKDLLSTLGEHFQWVVLDSPPVLAVTDAALVAHLAEGVVFVIGAEMTSRRAAATAMEHLERANGRCIGAVLNRVNLDRDRYYYSRYYRREYAEYYKTASAF